MYGEQTPDECTIMRCEDGGDSVAADDYSEDSNADSGETDN